MPDETGTLRTPCEIQLREQGRTHQLAAGGERVGQGRSIGGFEHEEVTRAAGEGMVGEHQGAVRAEGAVGMGAAIATGAAASAGWNVEELFQVGMEAVAIRSASRRQITRSQERIGAADDHWQAVDTSASCGWGKPAGVRRCWPR